MDKHGLFVRRNKITKAVLSPVGSPLHQRGLSKVAAKVSSQLLPFLVFACTACMLVV